MRKAFLFRSSALILVLSLSGPLAGAASSPKHAVVSRPSSKIRQALRKDFVDSCLQSFSRSANPASEEVSREICECTAKESGHQGVSDSALKKETAAIRDNPKYEIRNEALMNSFRWCTIELMKRES